LLGLGYLVGSVGQLFGQCIIIAALCIFNFLVCSDTHSACLRSHLAPPASNPAAPAANSEIWPIRSWPSQPRNHPINAAASGAPNRMMSSDRQRLFLSLA